MRKRKIEIYVDFNASNDWIFAKKLNETYDVLVKIGQTNHLHGTFLKNLLRKVLYFLYPIKWLFSSQSCDVVVAWQQFFGINLAFFQRLFRLKKKKKMVIMTFIYNKKNGLIGHLYEKYVKYSIDNKYVDKIIVFSKAEVIHYKAIFGVDKFQFVHLGHDVPKICNAKTEKERVILGVGRSNRDWEFLIEVIMGTKYKVEIMCDDFEYTNCPKNVKIVRGCYNQEMLQKMSKSYCVVIPLKDAMVSAGQLSILQAMALGKPVIATQGSATIDYVKSGINGLLIENKKELWLESLAKLFSNADFYSKLSLGAKHSYESNYTIAKLSDSIAIILENL